MTIEAIFLTVLIVGAITIAIRLVVVIIEDRNR